MGILGWSSVAAAALVVLALSPHGLASPAAVDSVVVAVAPGGDPTTGAVGARGAYATAVVVADVAGTLTLVNADVTAHDVISEAVGPIDNAWCPRFAGNHPCPLFASPIVGLGQKAVVEGTDQLVPGETYPFFCSVHHWMTGILVAI